MEDYIAGKHSVLEAMRSGRSINKIWVAEQAQASFIQPVLSEAKQHGIIVATVDRRKLDQMVPQIRHQGVVAQVAAYEYVELDEILQRLETTTEEDALAPIMLILDGIEDPHNLGSMLRTADCAGVAGVIIPKRRAVGITAAVSKISAGAVEHVPVARVTNISRTIEELKAKGVWIVGADGGAEQEVYDIDLDMPIAIVIGNENEGISRLVKEKCDFLVKLPMAGRINSLNASVAASIIMYEAVRQRRNVSNRV